MWIKNVTREVRIFPADGVTRSFGGTSKVFNIPFDYKEILFIDNTWWYKKEDYDTIKSIFKEKIENDASYVSNILEKQRKVGEELKKYVREISSKIYSKDEFLVAVEEYDRRMTEFYSFWWIAIPSGEVLEEKVRTILSKKQTDISFEDLLFSPKELELIKERKQLIELSEKIRNVKNFSELSSEIKKEFEDHAEQFSWINTSYHVGTSLNAEDFFEMAKSFDPETELQAINDEKNKQERISKAVVQIFSANEMNFLNAMHDIMYLRNYQKETVNECQHNSEPFLKGGAQLLQVTFEDFLSLSPKEVIEELKKSGSDPESIRNKASERKKDFGIVFKDGKSEVVTGTEKFEVELYGDQKIEPQSEIKGSPACKGLVKGKVRVILNKEELKSFKKGDVLVTIMTSVDYVQSMKEASAIVTDEGGITCHAAIFSREFNIPCVIGTKNATKILKTGDEVEVDANKGIIKKLI